MRSTNGGWETLIPEHRMKQSMPSSQLCKYIKNSNIHIKKKKKKQQQHTVCLDIQLAYPWFHHQWHTAKLLHLTFLDMAVLPSSPSPIAPRHMTCWINNTHVIQIRIKKFSVDQRSTVLPWPGCPSVRHTGELRPNGCLDPLNVIHWQRSIVNNYCDCTLPFNWHR